MKKLVLEKSSFKALVQECLDEVLGFGKPKDGIYICTAKSYPTLYGRTFKIIEYPKFGMMKIEGMDDKKPKEINLSKDAINWAFKKIK